MKLKTADECIKYLEKRIQNNQNIVEVNYFNSIIYYIAALKRKAEDQDTFHNILCDVLGINEDECLSDEALSDILNNDEWSEETKNEVETILQEREKKYDNYTKIQVEKNINEKEIEALREGLCQ